MFNNSCGSKFHSFGNCNEFLHSLGKHLIDLVQSRVEVLGVNQLLCDFLGLSECVYRQRGRDWSDLSGSGMQMGHKTLKSVVMLKCDL